MGKLSIVNGMIALFVLLSACNGKGQPAALTATNGQDMLRFKTFSYVDETGTGIEAFHFLMPVGWEFAGGIRWVLDNPTLPAVAAFQVYNPTGREAFEGFANHCYFWTDNPMTMNLFPPGSRYFGSEVRQPMRAQDALKHLILPEARGGVTRLEILDEQPLPELARVLGAGSQGYAEGAKIRIAYELGGVPMEEELYGVVEQLVFPIQTMYGMRTNIIWYVDYLFSFRAERGQLENNAKLFQTIAYSFRVNPKWYAKYSHVIEYLIRNQIQRIHSIGEFSRLLSQMSDEMSRDNLRQFEERGAVYDKAAENFSDYMLNINRYYDPFEQRTVELPSGYNHAWVNNNGEYILTDNPNFNPNEGSNLHWEPMQMAGRTQ